MEETLAQELAQNQYLWCPIMSFFISLHWFGLFYVCPGILPFFTYLSSLLRIWALYGSHLVSYLLLCFLSFWLSGSVNAFGLNWYFFLMDWGSRELISVSVSHGWWLILKCYCERKISKFFSSILLLSFPSWFLLNL